MIKNIESIIIQNNFVSQIYDHQSNHKFCIQVIEEIDQSKVTHYKEYEKFKFEKFQSMYDAKTNRASVEQYVNHQISKIFIEIFNKIFIKIFILFIYRRCFRIFRCNNELHKHLRCIHLKFRHRRRFNDRFLFIDRRLNQF